MKNEYITVTGSSYSTEVNLNGLIEVLSKHLYSTPVVAVRELVQNGHDAIVRRRIEQPDAPKDNQIRVVADVAKSTITITDTGAGLTESEIHGFLATVGVGYTRMLRQQDDNTGLIGMFGLGFLSAFVLAKEVTVLTTSGKRRIRAGNTTLPTGKNIPLRRISPRRRERR